MSVESVVTSVVGYLINKFYVLVFGLAKILKKPDHYLKKGSAITAVFALAVLLALILCECVRSRRRYETDNKSSIKQVHNSSPFCQNTKIV
jgi:hypothetical protein